MVVDPKAHLFDLAKTQPRCKNKSMTVRPGKTRIAREGLTIVVGVRVEVRVAAKKPLARSGLSCALTSITDSLALPKCDPDLLVIRDTPFGTCRLPRSDLVAVSDMR